jgi:hypothetical protein
MTIPDRRAIEGRVSGDQMLSGLQTGVLYQLYLGTTEPCQAYGTKGQLGTSRGFGQESVPSNEISQVDS